MRCSQQPFSNEEFDHGTGAGGAQKGRATEHIEEGYRDRAVPEDEAKATVNKMTGGGKNDASGHGKAINKAMARKGGRKGGAASASRSAAERSASAKRAAQTRTRTNGETITRSNTAPRCLLLDVLCHKHEDGAHIT